MDNKQLIDKFLEFCIASGLGKLRIIKYKYTLPIISKWLNKPFEKATKDDIIQLIANIEKSAYKDWTKHDYKVIIKRFYKWLKDSDTYPPEVSWIKTSMANRNNILPEEMPTEKDIDTLVNSANNIRDKAFIYTLYSSGCRISEILNLKIKHITFDEYSPIIVVGFSENAKKTGSRRIRLIDKQGFLKMWLDSHPLKDNPDAYVFISLSYKTRFNNQTIDASKLKPMKYQVVANIFKTILKKSGLKKKITFHILRKSRASHLAGKLTEFQMDKMFGWKIGSDVPQIYVAMSGRDIDDSLLKISGLLDKKEHKKQKLSKLLLEEISSDSESAKMFDKILDRLESKGKLKELE